MKTNYLYKLILVFFLALGLYANCSKKAPVDNQIFELVTSRHGEFKLQESQEGEVSFKTIFQKEIEVFRSQPNVLFQFYQSFQLGNEDVLVFLSEDSSEKNCSARFFILSVQKENDIVFLPEFGNCHDTPEIAEETGKLVFRFSSTKTELSQTVVYENRKLEVTESKLSKK